MRIKGIDLIESSIKQFIDSSLEEELIFCRIDIVNYGGLTGYHLQAFQDCLLCCYNKTK
jgi:hypothetical protein